MTEAAHALSKPFEFVRVDLYDGSEGIFFGELTFSPAAALGIAPSALGDHAVNPTHLAYSAALMSAATASPIVAVGGSVPDASSRPSVLIGRSST